MERYQVAILGGGPGGYVAAIRCAQHGLKTVLIEAGQLGGTCLNRGCIPTKALLHGAMQYAHARTALANGVLHGDICCDYAAIAAQKDKIVRQLNAGVASLEQANGVTVVTGRGRLIDPHTIDVNDARLQADQIILATGSAPAKPPIPGMDGKRVITSDETLALTERPDSLVIVGGGVIGIEFATLFSALGTKVTILELQEEILPGIGSSILRPLKKRLKTGGVTMLTSAGVLSVVSDDTHATVRYSYQGNEQSVDGTWCIVCTGRKPQTRDLGLEACGVATEKGFVCVDETMRTNVSGIYAIGDVTGKQALAHVASAQGAVAADNCAGILRRMRYDAIPACIYTEPEIACIGMTPDRAKADGLPVTVGSFPMGGNGKSLIEGCTDGIAEIVTDSRTGQILGAQLYAPRATDMIGEIAAAMRAEGTIDELVDTVHAHPTVSEGIFEAACDVLGTSCHKIRKK